VIHHDGAEADEAAGAEGAAVDHRHVADEHVVADVGGGAAASHVDHRAVLDVGAGADADRHHVSAEDAVVPDGRVLAEVDVADDLRAGGDPGGLWRVGETPWKG
jgi:hypothetical protein